MKSGTAPVTEPSLSEVARHVVTPSGIASTGWPAVRKTCGRLGWRFDRWQDGAGRLIVAKRSDGTYAADEIVISIPRQVGKTYLVACIIFALCLLHERLTVIWTAHHKTTAAETFVQFDSMSQRPKVAPHVRQVLRGKGDEQILFANGSRILFGARESGFGRGFSDVDVLVLDEAQILRESTMEDMGATQNVAENPLTFLMGTPPRPKDPGEYFTLLREEALAGDSDGSLYIELSADRDADLMDRAQWRRANPSFPKRTTERAMLRLRKKLKNDDSWRREALGIWDEVAKHVPVVMPSEWAGLVDPGPDDLVAPDAFGVDMSHRREVSISAMWVVNGDAHGEEVWAGLDTAAAAEWLASRAKRQPVAIDSMSPAASLIAALKAKGVNVTQTGAADMAKACGLVFDDLRARRLTHGGQERLTDAVKGAKRRKIGNAGGWGWDRTDGSVNIAPLVSWTLARLAAERNLRRNSNKTDKTRRAVVL